MVHFKCVYCGQRILANEDGRGKKGYCPTCRHVIYVPQASKADSIPLKLQPLATPKARISPSDKNSSITDELSTATSTDDMTDIFEEKLGFLIPNYDELSLFLMAVVFVILYFANGRMQEDITRFLMRLDVWRRYIYVALFMFAMFLCLYHVFTKRQKTDAEKGIMLLFAVTVNVVTGFIAGFYMLKGCPGWLLVFPLWNIINSALIIIMQYVNLFDESHISDHDATITQVILGLIAVLVIFFLCNNTFELHWAITYSICIIYTTSFDRGLQSVFPGLTGQKYEQSSDIM